MFGGTWAHDQTSLDDPAASLESRFVVEGPDKLILPAAPTRAPELYDLLTDPDERHDRAALEPERVAELRAQGTASPARARLSATCATRQRLAVVPKPLSRGLD